MEPVRDDQAGRQEQQRIKKQQTSISQLETPLRLIDRRRGRLEVETTLAATTTITLPAVLANLYTSDGRSKSSSRKSSTSASLHLHLPSLTVSAAPRLPTLFETSSGAPVDSDSSSSALLINDETTKSTSDEKALASNSTPPLTPLEQHHHHDLSLGLTPSYLSLNSNHSGASSASGSSAVGLATRGTETASIGGTEASKSVSSSIGRKLSSIGKAFSVNSYVNSSNNNSGSATRNATHNSTQSSSNQAQSQNKLARVPPPIISISDSSLPIEQVLKHQGENGRIATSTSSSSVHERNLRTTSVARSPEAYYDEFAYKRSAPFFNEQGGGVAERARIVCLDNNKERDPDATASSASAGRSASGSTPILRKRSGLFALSRYHHPSPLSFDRSAAMETMSSHHSTADELSGGAADSLSSSSPPQARRPVGGSSKAAAMLGISPSDLSSLATASGGKKTMATHYGYPYTSLGSQHPSSQQQQQQSHPLHLHQPLSPLSHSHHSGSSGNDDNRSTPHPYLKGSSTLKKARSLFSSVKSSTFRSPSESPTSASTPAAPRLPLGVSGVSHGGAGNGLGRLVLRGGPSAGNNTLSHSRSHGNLGGLRDSSNKGATGGGGQNYRFPSSGIGDGPSSYPNAPNNITADMMPYRMGPFSATSTFQSIQSSRAGPYDTYYTPSVASSAPGQRHAQRQPSMPGTETEPQRLFVTAAGSVIVGGVGPGNDRGSVVRQPLAGRAPTASSIADEEDDPTACPICLESLSIRMLGEAPHVVPVCGHKLHAACFTEAYGVTAKQARRDQEKKAMHSSNMRTGAGKNDSLCVCRICRAEMWIAEDGGHGKKKFAALSGEGGPLVGPANLDTYKINSVTKRTIEDNDSFEDVSLHGRSNNSSGTKQGVTSLHDPSEDHDIVSPNQHLPAYMQHIALSQQGYSNGFAHVAAVQPRITVRAEHATITRPLDPEKKIHLTCMVTVEIPARSGPSTSAHRLNGYATEISHHHHNSQSTILPVGSMASDGVHDERSGMPRRESNATARTSETAEDFPTSPSVSAFSAGVQVLPQPSALSRAMERNFSTVSSTQSSILSPATGGSTRFTSPGSVSAPSFVTTSSGSPAAKDDSYAIHNNSSVKLATAAQEEKAREAHGPFATVFEDLQNRMVDWKGHQPANFGSLRMFDNLQVRKDRNVREFVVYLFEEALLCVVDDRKKREHVEGSRPRPDDKLRLKGRVFVRHMKQVEDTSSVGTGLSLTIHMEDDSLESFVILFANRETLEVWRSQIQALIDHHRPPISHPQSKSSSSGSASGKDEVGSKRDSIFSARSGQSFASRFTKATTAPSLTGSSKASAAAMMEQTVPPLPNAAIQRPGLRRADAKDAALLNWTPPDPVTYTPLDLMLVISIPPVHVTGPSNNTLKLRLLRSTLDFIIHSVGPRARLCIVTYTVGEAFVGALRKTPWLATGRADGIKRLEQVVSDLSGDSPGSPRYIEGLVPVDPKEDKVTVATAANLALDIILQRQVKSAISGMILLNDGRDGAQKQHIEIVQSRAEAGKVPIHTFGWGKAHDPSSLWLLSNYTKGTYTFIRDFYQLKEALAGCIGGMLSVAVTSLRLHLNVQERRWFRIRKVAGVASAIVSSDGKDVDINLGELRFGEKKEMLVEVEFGAPRSGSPSRDRSGSGLKRQPSMTATDDFFIKRVGMDPHSFTDISEDFYDEIGDTMADDVPIFEVNASYRNPLDELNSGHKLPYPALLTITVLPPPKQGPVSPSSSTASTVSEPTIVRRRMELLTSDMITRTLLLMSRRQDSQARRLLTETTRIFGAIIANLIPPGTDDDSVTMDARYANDVLLACLDDVEQLKAGCADRTEFESITRNYGAQQAVTLRDQRAWTDRSSTEALFFNREWTAIFGNALASTSF